MSISPVTSAALRQQGWEPQIEATSYTMEGIVPHPAGCIERILGSAQTPTDRARLREGDAPPELQNGARRSK